MKLRLTSLTLLSLYSSIANAYTYGLGKSWLIGQGSNSSIQKVSTTFNPGIPPPGQISSLKLYPGLSNGDLRFYLRSLAKSDQKNMNTLEHSQLGLLSRSRSHLGIYNGLSWFHETPRPFIFNS
ncbi:hypothetical protein ACEPAI_9737 [Sanghuangporus weigelae]